MDETPITASDNVKAVLQKALDESIELQSHYAKLLNQYDGGKRIGFKDSVAWIMRLREIGVLTSVPDATEAHPAPVNLNPPASVSPQLPSGMEEIAKKAAEELLNIHEDHWQDCSVAGFTDVILRAMQQTVAVVLDSDVLMPVDTHIRLFSEAILHGDEEHRAWLLEAAEAYITGNPLPPPRSKKP